MELKKTPLYETHKGLGARFVDFAGYSMPVQYDSVIKEHLAVRNSAGLFDVSHMGEIMIRGGGAYQAVQRFTTNDVSKLRLGHAQYSMLCNDQGGVIDDLLVYCIAEDCFLLCVNASNRENVLDWIISKELGGITITDVSDETAMLALQGPRAEKILAGVVEFDPKTIQRNRFIKDKVSGRDAIISRTGYTGEDGFEFFISPADTCAIWDGLMESGSGGGITPVGLAARDTLRLEMGYPLHGHELSEEITPLEAGLGFFVDFEHDHFYGKDALLKEKHHGSKKKLAGFTMNEPGIPRTGYKIMSDGNDIGEITSGTHSPSLKKAIALGFITPELTKIGTGVEIEIRGRAIKAEVAPRPFYKK